MGILLGPLRRSCRVLRRRTAAVRRDRPFSVGVDRIRPARRCAGRILHLARHYLRPRAWAQLRDTILVVPERGCYFCQRRLGTAARQAWQDSRRRGAGMVLPCVAARRRTGRTDRPGHARLQFRRPPGGDPLERPFRRLGGRGRHPRAGGGLGAVRRRSHSRHGRVLPRTLRAQAQGSGRDVVRFPVPGARRPRIVL
jgi:hypothetical protein